MDDPGSFGEWLSPLIVGLNSGERLKFARTIGQQLRRSQSQRIAAQKNPDGRAFDPRKPQSRQYQQKNTQNARHKKGSIRRSMFIKMKAAKYMRIQASPEAVSIGFTGRVARIARVHQYGLRDRVQKNGPEVQYAKRELLGLSQQDEEMIKETVIYHLMSHQ